MLEIISATLTLLLVIDPLGNIPVFLATLNHLPRAEQKRILIREMLIALALLLFFLYFGKYFLVLLSLDQETISISGGVILFIIAIRLIFSQSHNALGIDLDNSPIMFPLAVPLIAGPSAIATVMLLASSQPDNMSDWTIAVIIAWLISTIILFYSSYLYRLLSETLITAITRLMGILLIMIAIQMILDGFKTYLLSGN